MVRFKYDFLHREEFDWTQGHILCQTETRCSIKQQKIGTLLESYISYVWKGTNKLKDSTLDLIKFKWRPLWHMV